MPGERVNGTMRSSTMLKRGVSSLSASRTSGIQKAWLRDWRRWSAHSADGISHHLAFFFFFFCLQRARFGHFGLIFFVAYLSHRAVFNQGASC